MRSPAHRDLTEPSRFRVQAPNSSPRDILVVALDPKSAALAPELAASSWRNTRFVNFGESAIDPRAPWLEDAALPDLLILVGTVGEDLGMADAIGPACSRRGVKVSSILLSATDPPGEALAAALLRLRPWSHMVSVLGADSYLAETLHALGASR